MRNDPFVAQLTGLCRAEHIRTMWVMVPTHAIGLTLGDRLAIEGTDWANLRFVTPMSLALETAAPFLMEQGLDPLPEGLGGSLLMRLLMELPDSVPAYFRPLADQPQMGDALWAAIREMRLTGVSADAIAGLLGPPPLGDDRDGPQPDEGPKRWRKGGRTRATGTPAGARKYDELRALMEAYESHLAKHKLADAAGVFRAAAAHPDHSPVGSTDIVITAAGLTELPLVHAFLDSLPGQHVAGATPLVPGLELPRRMRERNKTKPASSAGTGHAPLSGLAFLLEPGQAPSAGLSVPPPLGDARDGPQPVEGPKRCREGEKTFATGMDTHAGAETRRRAMGTPVGTRLELFHAAGREAEVEGVLRRILAAPSAIPLDQVEVACASREYVDLLWEKAQRLGLPLTVERGIPVTTTCPARALLGLCDWVGSNFVSGRLRRLLQAGDIRIEFPDGAAGGLAARLLLRSEATWGRATYDQSLAGLAARDEARAEYDGELDDEQRADRRAKAARARFLREWIGRLLALIPPEDEHGAVSLADLVRGLSAFLEDRVAVTGPLDAPVIASMRQALDDLLALGDLRRPMRQTLAFVRDAVDGLSVGASRARPGHLHVSSLASAGHAGRPFTFIVGLQEGGVFPPLLEDPVLLDGERRQLSPWLPTSHDRLEEAVYAVLTRLAALPVGGVTLSYSCRDLRNGRETLPSWLMLQALRLKNADASLTYDDLRDALRTPETLVPATADQALTDAGWWLTHMKEARGKGSDAVLDAFPLLAAGRRAQEARESDRFTEWDGFVPTAGTKLDPRLSLRPVSVTQIEGLAGCPFRYFLEHGLGVEILEDDDPDHDEWLDARQKGSALHEVYATLGRAARATGRRLSPASDAARARQVAEEKLAELRADCPPPSDVVFDRERADFLRDVELFLEFEAERPLSDPVAFELSFGREPGGEEPLAQAEPFKMSLGESGSALIRGIIDRIDRLPDGGFEVIDYKTGGFKREKWQGTFRGGAMLQHAVYGLAAAQMLRALDAKPKIARGVYEFPSARGGGERVPIPPPSRSEIVGVLSDLFDVMADGAFVAAGAKEKACDFCDFGRACGMAGERGSAKLDDLENTGLDAYRRLKAHE
jgi:RecB family exonuclease